MSVNQLALMPASSRTALSPSTSWQRPSGCALSPRRGRPCSTPGGSSARATRTERGYLRDTSTCPPNIVGTISKATGVPSGPGHPLARALWLSDPSSAAWCPTPAEWEAEFTRWVRSPARNNPAAAKVATAGRRREGRKPRFALGPSRYDRLMWSLIYLVARALARLLVGGGQQGQDLSLIHI